MLPNILIVDDMSVNRKIVKTILKKNLPEYEILDAENGKIALEIIEIKRIGVMILDIIMPEMNGIDVLKALKSGTHYQELQVIVWTELNEIDMVKKALELGALDYFTKPLTKEEINITLPLKVKNAMELYNHKCKLLEYYNKTKADLKLAEKMQKALIATHSKFMIAEMWGAYFPFDEIGGDMFSFKEHNGKVWFMIADVSGHGISPAMISSMVNVLFNTAIDQCRSTKDLLDKFNNTLNETFRDSKNILVSAFVGRIENENLYYSNAGHPYPVLIKKDENCITALSTNGFLLGMMDEGNYKEEFIKLSNNDIIALYTDGLYDKGGKNQYSKWKTVHSYCEIYRENILENEKNFINEMIEHFKKDGEGNFIDDVAVMLIRVTLQNNKPR